MATQSEYFDSVLYGSMRESKENNEIELKHVSLSSFQLLLHYAYTGRVELNGAKLQVRILSTYNGVYIIIMGIYVFYHRAY